MTQEERKNIRTRTEKERIAFPTRRSTVIHRDTIFSLLDDLDEAEATITDKDAEIARLLDKLETLESHYNLARHHYHLVSEVRDRQIARAEALETERDIWKGNAQSLAGTVSEMCRYKARTEALERAIKQLPHNVMNPACHICIHRAKQTDFYCGNPNGGCKNGNYVGWQFDESRFAGKVAQHEK